ncbi:MAG TPA: SDR family oxidoreductase [Steroidobacteraceae bacterium]|nr:SDR family oxidoreductase [Steroidobacteraceae bacterium]
MPRRSFNGATVLVTGAGSGLGHAIAEHFAAAGAHIVALDKDAAAVARLQSELEARGRACLAVPCDVTDPDACARAVAAAVERFGAIDVLVNNAGMSHRSGLAETDLTVIRRVMDVNFYGAIHCTKAALPRLIERRGLVIAISSVAGYTPLIARTGYAASKHALHGFFESLRTELAPQGVHVMMACPSFIATQIDRNALGGDGQPVRHAQVTIGRPLTPDAAAQQIVAGAARDRRLLLIGRTARIAWWVSRLAPALYEKLMARRLRGELESGTNTARTSERKPRP